MARRRFTIRFAENAQRATGTTLHLLDWAARNFGYELADAEPTATDIDRIVAERTTRMISRAHRADLLRTAKAAWAAKPGHRNPWGWSTLRLQEMMEGAHEREHPRPRSEPVPPGKAAHYKGYRILPAAGGWMVPELEAESRFDTVKDAQRFIAAQEKGKPNPKRNRLPADRDLALRFAAAQLAERARRWAYPGMSFDDVLPLTGAEHLAKKGGARTPDEIRFVLEIAEQIFDTHRRADAA